MVANPVIAADNSISALFGDLPVFSRVFKFDPTLSTYSIFTRTGTGASDWIGDAVGTTVLPGEGVFVFNFGAEITITFSGEVAQGASSNTTIAQGFSIVSSVVAQGGLLQTDLGFPASVFDRVFLFDPATQGYSIRTYTGSSWLGGEPQVEVADAFFVQKQAETAWDRNFDPNAQ
jgi:hypothetical protein